MRSAITYMLLMALTAVPADPGFARETVGLLLPLPGTRVELSQPFVPPSMKGITVDAQDPMKFVFLIHRGDVTLDAGEKDAEYRKLIKYFLSSLTVPDKDQWVNLSPYEGDRIAEPAFGNTEMGRDLLAQDYLLKQITSSLMYPESGVGRDFWNRVYTETWEKFHTTNVPLNTFNKVWIVPDSAAVFENGRTAYLLNVHLKVMLEEDYLASTQNRRQPGDMFDKKQPRTCPQAGCQTNKVMNVKATQGTNGPPNENRLATQIIREIIIPQLTTEVNSGKNFARLRQIVSGMVLAAWYKKALKKSLLGRVYADRGKTGGLQGGPVNGAALDVERIYDRYLQAFKRGTYNYVREEMDPHTGRSVPRKYFAGGFMRLPDRAMVVKRALTAAEMENARTEERLLDAVDAGFRPWQPLGKSSAPIDAAMLTDADFQGLLNRFKEQEFQLAPQYLEEIRTHIFNRYSNLLPHFRNYLRLKDEGTGTEREESAIQQGLPGINAPAPVIGLMADLLYADEDRVDNLEVEVLYLGNRQGFALFLWQGGGDVLLDLGTDRREAKKYYEFALAVAQGRVHPEAFRGELYRRIAEAVINLKQVEIGIVESDHRRIRDFFRLGFNMSRSNLSRIMVFVSRYDQLQNALDDVLKGEKYAGERVVELLAPVFKDMKPDQAADKVRALAELVYTREFRINNVTIQASFSNKDMGYVLTIGHSNFPDVLNVQLGRSFVDVNAFFDIAERLAKGEAVQASEAPQDAEGVPGRQVRRFHAVKETIDLFVRDRAMISLPEGFSRLGPGRSFYQDGNLISIELVRSINWEGKVEFFMLFSGSPNPSKLMLEPLGADRSLAEKFIEGMTIQLAMALYRANEEQWGDLVVDAYSFLGKRTSDLTLQRAGRLESIARESRFSNTWHILKQIGITSQATDSLVKGVKRAAVEAFIERDPHLTPDTPHITVKINALMAALQLSSAARPGVQKALYKDIGQLLAALSRDAAMVTAPGGIDLNAARMNLSVGGSGVQLPAALSPEEVDRLSQARGLEPVILKIAPVEALPFAHNSASLP